MPDTTKYVIDLKALGAEPDAKPAPAAEVRKPALDEFGRPIQPPPGWRQMVAGGLRVGGSILGSTVATVPSLLTTLSGAGIGGVAELGAEAVEGSLGKSTLGRVGIEAVLSGLPGGAMFTPGSVGKSALKGAALAEMGNIGRRWARQESTTGIPKTKSELVDDAMGMIVGGGMGAAVGKMTSAKTADINLPKDLTPPPIPHQTEMGTLWEVRHPVTFDSKGAPRKTSPEAVRLQELSAEKQSDARTDISTQLEKTATSIANQRQAEIQAGLKDAIADTRMSGTRSSGLRTAPQQVVHGEGFAVVDPEFAGPTDIPDVKRGEVVTSAFPDLDVSDATRVALSTPINKRMGTDRIRQARIADKLAVKQEQAIDLQTTRDDLAKSNISTMMNGLEEKPATVTETSTSEFPGGTLRGTRKFGPPEIKDAVDPGAGAKPRQAKPSPTPPPEGTAARDIYDQWTALGRDHKTAMNLAMKGRPPLPTRTIPTSDVTGVPPAEATTPPVNPDVPPTVISPELQAAADEAMLAPPPADIPADELAERARLLGRDEAPFAPKTRVVMDTDHTDVPDMVEPDPTSPGAVDEPLPDSEVSAPVVEPPVPPGPTVEPLVAPPVKPLRSVKLEDAPKKPGRGATVEQKVAYARQNYDADINQKLEELGKQYELLPNTTPEEKAVRSGVGAQLQAWDKIGETRFRAREAARSNALLEGQPTEQADQPSAEPSPGPYQNPKTAAPTREGGAAQTAAARIAVETSDLAKPARPVVPIVQKPVEKGTAPRQLMTTKQVAEKLGVGEKTVERRAAAGELPVLKIGESETDRGTTRYRPEEVDVFQKQHYPTSEEGVTRAENTATTVQGLEEDLKNVEAIPVGPERKALLEKLRGEGGEVNPTLAIRLGLAVIGGTAGYVTDPLGDPLTSAAAGTAAGAFAPTAISNIMKSVGSRTPRSSDAISKALDVVGQELPNFQRFSYLSNIPGLMVNTFVGPWGSGVMNSLELWASGNPVGRQSLVELFKPSMLKRFMGKIGESKQVIGRAEGIPYSEAVGPIRKMLATPGVFMTAGDIWVRDALMRGGMTQEMARRATLTGEHTTRWGKGVAAGLKGARFEDGSRSALSHLMLPFEKTTVNIFEQGMERIPFLGEIAQRRWKMPGTKDPGGQRFVQQALGTGVWYMSYLLGENIDPENARFVRKVVSNAGGQYSLLASTGFAAGQASRSGKANSLPEAAMTGVRQGVYDTPVPTTQILEDYITSVRKLYAAASEGDLGAIPDALPRSMKPWPLSGTDPVAAPIQEMLGMEPK